MKKYFKYFWYVCEHKFNVGIECLKMGLFIHAITHDISKFLPSEFIPYAKYFYGSEEEKSIEEFRKGWLLHQRRNKHHWNYWVSVEGRFEEEAVPMPKKYVMQMVADWKGMSRKFGGTWLEFYMKNKDRIVLHEETFNTLVNYEKRNSIFYKKRRF